MEPDGTKAWVTGASLGFRRGVRYSDGHEVQGGNRT